MSMEQTVQQRPVANEQYEVIRKDPGSGVAILADPDGQLELWERVKDYRGEILVIDGEEYRFGRTWHGVRSGN